MDNLVLDSLYKKLYVLKTLSIIDINYLSKWEISIDGEKKILSLPISFPITNRTTKLKIKVYIDPEKGFPTLLFNGAFNALMLVNNEYYYGVDVYTKKIPLYGVSGETILELHVYPQGIVGERYEKPFIDKIFLLYIDKTIESFIDKLIWLLDLSKHVGEDVRREIISLVDNFSAKIPLQTPEPMHFLVMKYYVENNLSHYSMLYDELMRLSRDEPEKLRGMGYGAINREEIKSIINYLKPELEAELKKLREKYGKYGLLYAVANAHIDAAWLWSVEDTVWKMAKTIAKIITQFKAYNKPVYVFSSALYAEWLKEKYPSLWSEVVRLADKERIIPVTGMYVESDVYIIPSESLARQFLIGQKTFEKLFGKRSIIGWLPDSFGFSPNLPQVMKEAGIKFFVTHKVIWNEYNKFPYDTFLWRGIDGTNIPTHIITGELAKTGDPKSILELWREYREKQVVPARIYTYGYCDGGSGPTHEMIEKLEFYSEETPLTPRIIHGRINDFIDKIMENSDKLPVWYGDIYVETHRGAYTTDTCIKQKIWILDYLLRTLEQIYTWLYIKGSSYPEEEINNLWKTLLLAEFHDVLSGTITYEVHKDICTKLSRSITKAKEMINEGLRKLVNDLEGIIIYNPTQWRRSEIIEINNKHVKVDVPGHGYIIIPINNISKNNKEKEKESKLIVKKDKEYILVENKFYKIRINMNGLITSIYDKHSSHELLRKPSALIKIYEDLPSEWDAWNIDKHSLEHFKELLANKVYVHRIDPYRAIIRAEYTYRNSKLFMDMIIYGDHRRIDFKINAFWRDKWRLVKIWFYPDINSTRSIRDTQFGVYERPTHTNTSWEKARFEEPMLSWASLEDGERGFAIISPYKHGVSIRFNEIGLSLIKSPVLPNPFSDTGSISVEFSILPYNGSWNTSKIHVEAKKIRDPLYVYVNNNGRNSYRKLEESLIEIEPENIIVESIKKSIEGDNIVLRIYESENKHGMLKIKTRFAISRAWRTNILEDKIREIPVVNNEIKYDLKPFELVSIMIQPASK